MKYGELNLGQVEALVNKVGGLGGVNRILSGELIVTENPKNGTTKADRKNLLEDDGTPVKLPATERFVAREKFKLDRTGELPVSYFGDNFKAHFLDVVEENVEPLTLKRRKLLKRSVDGPILNELGGEEKAKVALAHVFEYLKTADRNLWFIFYVADAKGAVWSVDAHWNDYGWDVRAGSVSYPCEWDDGSRVVSR